MCLTSDSIACEQNHWIFGFIFSAVIEDVITHPLKCDFFADNLLILSQVCLLRWRVDQCCVTLPN